MRNLHSTVEWAQRPTSLSTEASLRSQWQIEIQLSLVRRILEAKDPRLRLQARLYRVRYVTHSVYDEAGLIEGLLPFYRQLAAPENRSPEVRRVAQECIAQLERRHRECVRARAGYGSRSGAHRRHMPAASRASVEEGLRAGDLSRAPLSAPEAILSSAKCEMAELLLQLVKARKPSAGVASAGTGAGAEVTIGRALRELPNILGVGYGAKVVNGSVVGGPMALRVYVKAKRAKGKLSLGEVVPETVNGVPTDVIEAKEIIACSGVLCGSSIGSSYGPGSSGTLGCVVEKKNDTSQRYILSCSHVLADSPNAKRGDPIYSPAMRYAAPGSFKQIARLAEWTRLDPAPAVDAAIAELINPDEVSPHVEGIGQITPPTSEPLRFESVTKSGAKTGVTVGVIEDVSLTVKVDYRPLLSDPVIFHDSLAIRGAGSGRFCDRGDSGGLVFNALYRNALGMVFAGAPTGLGFAHKISAVLDQFAVRIL